MRAITAADKDFSRGTDLLRKAYLRNSCSNVLSQCQHSSPNLHHSCLILSFCLLLIACGIVRISRCTHNPFPVVLEGRRVWIVDEYWRAGPGSSLGSCPLYLSHIPGLWVSINTVVAQSKLFGKSE
ncbi:hypothetical protein DPX16_19376 [Anabarilius grahami]|uniref:Uncharacterized protein n=1 Tax=Anabarilius grahami TaxID=495550 RepID=A0A3N0YZX7_ANAGA|nr:hypothetical protein DPX16_19376 [Anabarilius grahami]